jgi:hypothetical protein
MVAPLVDQREAFNLALLQTLLLLLTARLNQLNLRLRRQSQFLIRGPLIQHTRQFRFPFHLRVAEDLLLALVDKVEMLHLAVSVAMAM